MGVNDTGCTGVPVGFPLNRITCVFNTNGGVDDLLSTEWKVGRVSHEKCFINVFLFKSKSSVDKTYDSDF